MQDFLQQYFPPKQTFLTEQKSPILKRKYCLFQPSIFSFHVGVSLNGGTPKSSILTGFSIINHPFLGTPILGNTHVSFQRVEPFSPTVYIGDHLLFYLLLSCPSCNALALHRDSGPTNVGGCQGGVYAATAPLNVEPPKNWWFGSMFLFFSSWWFFTTHLKNMLVKLFETTKFSFWGRFFFSFKMGLEDQTPFRMANFSGSEQKKLTKTPKRKLLLVFQSLHPNFQVQTFLAEKFH